MAPKMKKQGTAPKKQAAPKQTAPPLYYQSAPASAALRDKVLLAHDSISAPLIYAFMGADRKELTCILPRCRWSTCPTSR